MPTYSERRSFSKSALQELLSHGWIFSMRPGKILLGWGELNSSAEAPTELGSAAIYAPDFRLQDAKPWKQTRAWDLCDFDAFTDIVMAGVEGLVNAQAPLPLSWTEPNHELFTDKFELIQKRLRAGILQKAVPVVFATATGTLDERRILQILQNLVQLPPTLHLYGLWNLGAEKASSQAQGILGATPERLLSLRDSSGVAVIETMALAGTRAKTVASADGVALLQDPKERKEHQIVVDDIAQTLSTIGKVQMSETSVVELPTLFHLKTPISVVLDQAPARTMDLAQASKLLHPTPALGVAPRVLGFGEMDLWDDGKYRRRFGAPFGVSARVAESLKIEDCLVAIRNIQWSDENILLGSGCGVIEASQQEREWQELKLKRDSVKRMLGL
jgi:menaquinone-specific isochorismate synthase